MSADSLAILRKNVSEDIRMLADEHFKHDLNDSDRDTLKTAASKVGISATIGSLLGLGLGVFLAFRVRSSRTQIFNAFRTAEKPTHAKFADGREGTYDQFPHTLDLLFTFDCCVSIPLSLCSMVDLKASLIQHMNLHLILVQKPFQT